MKVLLINGSPRKNGNTSVALNEAAKQLIKNNIEAEVLWIGNKPVRGCIACNQCKANGNNKCVFNDDITNEVIAKMAECDAIIIGAPVYWGQPAAQAQALQQRMLYAGGSNFKGKPAAAVCVCRRGGASAAFQTLQMPFQMCNMPIVTSQYWNIAYGREEGQAAFDTEGLQTMRTLANNMAVMLQMYATGTAQKPEAEAWQPMNFIR
ncbi:MAG: flavodoxin family protein [Bacteroidales bacterium]|nr:flavodoxin family protein [Bacteroidales bacterium]MCQ2607866.1 flavodoxin family protein [Bacteroidales bacterium]